MCIDEMTGIQALERKAPDLPMRPGKVTSRTRREFAYLLSLLQGFALVSPLEGFSQRAPRMLRKRAVEVIGEFKDAGFQLSNACKTSSLE